MAATIDWTNPCDRAKALRKSYYELIQGERESMFTYMANGVTNTVQYTRASLQDVKAELAKAEEECAAAKGGRAVRRRQAIQFG